MIYLPFLSAWWRHVRQNNVLKELLGMQNGGRIKPSSLEAQGTPWNHVHCAGQTRLNGLITFNWSASIATPPCFAETIRGVRRGKSEILFRCEDLEKKAFDDLECYDCTLRLLSKILFETQVIFHVKSIWHCL